MLQEYPVLRVLKSSCLKKKKKRKKKKGGGRGHQDGGHAGEP
jgi:hypothetical protein